MMVGRDGHTIGESAESESGLDVGHALVAVLREVDVAADWRSGFEAGGLVLVYALERDLVGAVDGLGHKTTGSVGDEFNLLFGCFGAHFDTSDVLFTRPIARARWTSLTARLTTGGSIILDPRETTPRPIDFASSKAETILRALSISLSVGAKA